MNVEEAHRDVVFQVSGVVRYLYWLGKPAIIRNVEIKSLQKWLHDTVVTSFEVTGIEVGSVYTIETGPFSGMEGMVSKVDKNQMEIILEKLGFKVILKK